MTSNRAFDSQVAIIVLSDIHCVNQTIQDIAKRIGRLADSVGRHVSREKTIAVVYNGDLANSGKNEEYERFDRDVHRVVQNEFESHGYQDVHYFAVPGNHDIDRDIQCEERENLIAANPYRVSLSPGAYRYCNLPLTTYHEYVDRAQIRSVPRDSVACEIELVAIDNVAICLTLLNTCLLHVQPPSTMGFPYDDLLSQIELESTSVNRVRIAFMHHSHGWMQPDTARELKQILVNTYDAVITGHEHTHDHMKMTNVQSQSIFHATGPVLDPNKFNNSRYCIIEYDNVSRELRLSSIELNHTGTDYKIVNSESMEIDLSQKSARSKAVRPTESMINRLTSVEDPFKHPYKEKLSLDDVFIFPRVKRLDPSRSNEYGQYDTVNESLESIQGHRNILFLGEAHSGKSALLRHIAHQEQMAGKIPVFVRASELVKNNDAVEHVINENLNNQYVINSEATPSSYVKFNEIVVVIDDLHELSANRDRALKKLRDLEVKYARVLASADQDRISIQSRIELSEIIDCYEIMPLQMKDIKKLVDKWTRMAKGKISDVEYEELAKSTVNTAEHLASSKLVPLYPFYFLAAFTLSREAFAGHSSYAQIYEQLMSQTISMISKDPSLANQYTKYLEMFCFHISTMGRDSFTEEEFIDFRMYYERQYEIEIRSDKILEKLQKRGVIVRSEGALVFHYRYSRYYYTAKHISRLEGIVDLPLVQKLVSNLHLESSAIILSFVLQLSEDENLLEVIMNNAERTLKQYTHLVPSVHLTKIYSTYQQTIELALKSEKLAPANVETEMKMEPMGLSRPDTLPTDEQSLFDELSRAVGIVDILSSVCRAQLGLITAQTRNRLIKTVSELSMRTAMAVVSILNDNIDTAIERMRIDKARTESLDAHEFEELFKTSVNGIVLQYIHGCLRRASSCYGTGVGQALAIERIERHGLKELEGLIAYSVLVEHLRTLQPKVTQHLKMSYDHLSFAEKELVRRMTLSALLYNTVGSPQEVQKVCSILSVPEQIVHQYRNRIR